MKKKALIPLALLLLTFTMLIDPQPVRATSPSLTQSLGATGTSSTTLTVLLTLHAAGDTILVVEGLGAPTAVCSKNLILAPTDNVSNTYSAVSPCYQGVVGAPSSSAIQAFVTLVPSSNANKVLVTCNFGANSNIESCYVFDFAAGTVSTVIDIANNGGHSTSLSVASFTPQPGAFVLPMTWIEVNCAAVTPGSGFAALSPTSKCSSGYGLSGESEVWTSGSTTAPMTIGVSSVWIEEALEVEGVATPVAATTVVACTWFQLQCWLYPFMFFMFYTVVFMMIGALGGASGRGLTVLLLAGFDNAAVAATAMGMLTPLIPILGIVLTVVYMVRVR